VVARGRIKQEIKNAVYVGIGAVGQLTSLAGRGAAPLARVLMYHKVNPLPDNGPNVPPSLFAEQMRQLRDTHAPISLGDLLAALDGGRALPERAVLVTFDDGYRDTLENAAPLMHRLSIPAVIFLPTRFLGHDEPLPHDRRRAKAGILNPTLTWDEARRLTGLGFEIGSHGESHRVFSSLLPDEAAAEIRRSKQVLEEKLAATVRCFAYVKGSPDTYDEATVAAVREAGYLAAFSTLPGPIRSGDDRFTLRRYNVEPFGRYAFTRLLAGDCDLIALKDSPLGLRGKRLLNRLLGTTTS